MANKINKNILLLAYKLAYDLLALLLASFGALIVVNGMLPEFFLQSSIFVKLIWLIAGCAAFIAWLGKHLGIDFPLAKTSKNPAIPLLLVLTFLITGNALLKLRLWENIAITLLTLGALYQYFRLSTGPHNGKR